MDGFQEFETINSFGTRDDLFDFHQKRGSKLIAKVVELDDY